MSEVTLRTYDATTYTTVASSASHQSFLAANPLRKALIIQNTSTAILYVFFGPAASTTTTSHSVQIPSNQSYEIVGFKGAVGGIHASANGSVNLTEFT